MMEIEASEWYRAALETECSDGVSAQLTRPASSERPALLVEAEASATWGLAGLTTRGGREMNDSAVLQGH